MFEKGGRNVTRLSGSFSLELTCFHQDGFSQITREATEEKGVDALCVNGLVRLCVRHTNTLTNLHTEFGRINHALYLQGIQLHGLWLVCCLSSAILHLYGVYGLVSCSLKVFEKMDREATKPLKDWTAFLQTPCSSYERWPSASVTEKHIFTIFTEKFDINDWFPQDILSEIFAKALSEDIPPGVNAYQHDGAGVSLNVENHDPKNWSYFRKLAEEEFSVRDVPPGFPSDMEDSGVDTKRHHDQRWYYSRE
ncbi:hypothetical protein BRARA_F01145 [Brassica rapa]|uniref:Uncharacterized protein n=1 Tax=Brassica campestris TaxID=3711 RepID=A0A397Z672_BRACM|nr:hypothetical protein BRARA_F01145 [Brassica rapa]